MRNAIIMGAAGRDFHNFNVVFRWNPLYRVVCFTAAQIPDIAGRRYPPELAGEHYPEGIPIEAEADLAHLIVDLEVDTVVLAYSDLSHQQVMEKASAVLAAGATFTLLGPMETMIKSRRPVISITAARTGAGKSPTSRKVVDTLRALGWKPVVIRHPMPYGDLVEQAVQRFGSREDLTRHRCSLEEREEYEPHLENNTVVYSGVDYRRVLHLAEDEGDIIVWDGGNNDFSFLRSDSTITVFDPHRAGHELTYYPGAVNTRLADVAIISKVDSATRENIETVRSNIRSVNPTAIILEATCPITVDDPAVIRGRRVLVIEDGPTLTHGGLGFGAGVIAARAADAREIVDPRPHAVGSLARTYAQHPHLQAVLPAMGYTSSQMHDLEETISRSGAEALVIATPVGIQELMSLTIPSTRVRYALDVVSGPPLETVLAQHFPRER